MVRAKPIILLIFVSSFNLPLGAMAQEVDNLNCTTGTAEQARQYVDNHSFEQGQATYRQCYNLALLLEQQSKYETGLQESFSKLDSLHAGALVRILNNQSIKKWGKTFTFED